jgi:hypothetical protein
MRDPELSAVRVNVENVEKRTPVHSYPAPEKIEIQIA